MGNIKNDIFEIQEDLDTISSSNQLVYNDDTDYFGIMHNGEWKNIVFAGLKAVYLYYNGNEFTNQHGGTWTFNSNQSTANYYDFFNKGASIEKTKNTDNIYMKTTIPTNAGALGIASCYLSAAIDLTNYSKLVVRATVTGSKDAIAYIYSKLPKNILTSSNTVTYKSLGNGSNLETVVDISSCTGLNYILIKAGGYAGDSGGSSGSIQITVYEVRLES